MDGRSPGRAPDWSLASLVFAFMVTGALLTSAMADPPVDDSSAEDVPEFEPPSVDAGPPEPSDASPQST